MMASAEISLSLFTGCVSALGSYTRINTICVQSKGYNSQQEVKAVCACVHVYVAVLYLLISKKAKTNSFSLRTFRTSVYSTQAAEERDCLLIYIPDTVHK